MVLQRTQISDRLWEEIKAHLPLERAKPRGGRTRLSDRQAMEAILYILETRSPWKTLPKELGAASTIHDRFQEWDRLGVFEQLLKEGILKFDSDKSFSLKKED